MDFIEGSISHILFLPGIFPENCDSEYIDYPDISGIESENLNDIPENDSPNESDTDNISGINSRHDLEEIELSEIYDKLVPGSDKKIEEYDEMPSLYIDQNSWIKSINISCWYCGNIPDDIYFIPYAKIKFLLPVHNENQNLYIYLKDTEINKDELLINCQEYKEVKAYKIHGIFHILCAYTYINRISDNIIRNKRESKKMLIDIYNSRNNTNIYSLPEAEDPFIQCRYSGKFGITSEEYLHRNKLKEINYIGLLNQLDI